MRPALVAALLALALPAAAQSYTCVNQNTNLGFVLSCSPTLTSIPRPAEPSPPPPPPVAPATVDPKLVALVAQRDPRLELVDIMFRMARALTPQELAYARAQGVPGAELAPSPPAPPAPPSGPGFDPWTHRDLTGTHGNPLRFQGPAGTSARFELREPAGKKLFITAFRITSNFGGVQSLTVEVQGQRVTSQSSDAQVTIEIVSTGNDPVTVTLNEPGAAAVQLN